MRSVEPMELKFESPQGVPVLHGLIEASRLKSGSPSK